MIAWFAKNPVAANVLMLAIVFAGLYSWFFRTPIAAFPDFNPGVVRVYTSFPGGAPHDVETSITNRIEQAIFDLEGIEEITSESQEGYSRIDVKINYSYEVSGLRDEIQSRVFELTTLPENAREPVVFEVRGHNKHTGRLVMEVALYGDSDPVEIRDYAEVVYDEILNLPLVSPALIEDSQKYEITIEVPQQTLESYRLSLQEISSKINLNSQIFSGGNLKSPHQDILLRSQERAYTHEEFASLVIKSDGDGSLLRLGDISRISDAFESDKQAIVNFNGKPAALIRVYRTDDENVIDIADEVKEYLIKKQALLPDNIQIDYWGDWSAVVKKRLGTLTNNAIQGMIMVLLILSLFLRPTVALWVFVGVPVSILGAIITLPWFGVNVNIVSMLGFILLLGIVVDDAIVTGESIYYQMSRGKDPLTAAIDGTHAVNVPVTFGVLTTVAAFASMFALVQGTGLVVIFATIPAVIIPALLFSLVETKLVLPAHLSKVRYEGDKQGGGRLSRFQRNFSESFERAVIKRYRPLLAKCIRHRYAVILGFFGALIIAFTALGTGLLNFSFFPKVEGETLTLTFGMPDGTAPEITAKHAERIYETAEALREKYRDEDSGVSVVENIMQQVQDTQGFAYIKAQPPEERAIEVSTNELTSEWRKAVGNIPGSRYVQLHSSIIRIYDPINIQFRGSDSEGLQTIIREVSEKLDADPNVHSVADNISDGKDEIHISLKHAGHSLGLTRRSLMAQVRAAHYGIESQRIQRGRNEVRVLVKLPREERGSINDLRRLRIQLPNGEFTSLEDIAELMPMPGSGEIRHVDLKRAVNVTADLDKEQTTLQDIYAGLRPWLDERLARFPLINYSIEGEQADQEAALSLLAFSVGLALLAIYAMLAIPLKSFLAPLIILSVIPFSLVGVVFGHWLLGFDLTVVSLLGMIGLIGVIVNDSLLISAYIIERRAAGVSLRRAALRAGARRFRPVFLTTLTTFFGLLPMILEQSTQARFLVPMAISLSIGIVFATAITLVQVPILFVVLEDIKSALRSMRSRWRKSRAA